jgi:TatD DNase family protein
MGLIDTHTHLESFAHKGVLPAVLERARAAGVEAMITIGTSGEDWVLYRGLAREHAGFVHYTVGLHPCAVDENWERELARMDEFFASLEDGQPVAVGEIGLDRFHLPKDSPTEAEKIFAWQRAAFARGLQFARERGCPVVIHSRGAFAECVEMIDASGMDWTKVVFHCFTEGEAEMAALVRRGGYGSFTGILTYKSAENVRQAAKIQGLDRLMIETDAPYLSPLPHRGQPNEPAFMRHTAEFAAKEVFGVGYDELVARTTTNARRFFGLTAPVH